MQRFVLLLSILLWWGCQPETQQTSFETQVEDTLPPTPAVEQATEASLTSAVIEEPLDTLSLPQALNLQNVLLAYQYHSDEFWEEALTQKWYGLFQNKEGYYIALTTLRTKRVQDPVLDEGDAQTAWEVDTENEDTSVVLLSGIELNEQKVDDVPVDVSNLYYAKRTRPEYYKNIRQPRFSLLPDEQVSFQFQNIAYTLHATGNKKRSGEDWYPTTHYKLFLKAGQNGQTTEQLIVATAGFEDAEIQIIWIGDLDQDGKIDLIMDVSSHYNQARIAIFLSSKAKPGEWGGYFGECSMVGC